MKTLETNLQTGLSETNLFKNGPLKTDETYHKASVEFENDLNNTPLAEIINEYWGERFDNSMRELFIEQMGLTKQFNEFKKQMS